MVSFLTNFCIVVYLGCLLLAAGWDWVAFIIPNRLVLVLTVFGLIFLGLTADDFRMVGLVLGAAVAVLVVGAVLFFLHLWGAGDAKLLAAIALWVGPKGLPPLIFWTAMVGGVLALILLLLRRLPFINQNRLKLCGLGLLSSSQGVPYGVAIAAGGVAAFFLGHTSAVRAFLGH